METQDGLPGAGLEGLGTGVKQFKQSETITPGYIKRQKVQARMEFQSPTDNFMSPCSRKLLQKPSRIQSNPPCGLPVDMENGKAENEFERM